MNYYCVISTVNDKYNDVVPAASFNEAIKISEIYLDRLPRYSIREISIVENVWVNNEHISASFPKTIAQMRIAK